MVYVIKDILLPFMLPTYQQTRNADINGQIEAYLGADDTDLRLPEVNVPNEELENVNDIDIFIAEIHRKDTSMGWVQGPQGWRNTINTLIYRVHNFLKEAIRVGFRLHPDNDTLFLNEAEREQAPQLLE